MNYPEAMGSFPLFMQDPMVNTPDSMPFDYYKQTIGADPEPSKQLTAFNQVITHFSKVQSVPATIKTLTLILATITENKYDEDYLDLLS